MLPSKLTAHGLLVVILRYRRWSWTTVRRDGIRHAHPVL